MRNPESSLKERMTDAGGDAKVLKPKGVQRNYLRRGERLLSPVTRNFDSRESRVSEETDLRMDVTDEQHVRISLT